MLTVQCKSVLLLGAQMAGASSENFRVGRKFRSMQPKWEIWGVACSRGWERGPWFPHGRPLRQDKRGGSVGYGGSGAGDGGALWGQFPVLICNSAEARTKRRQAGRDSLSYVARPLNDIKLGNVPPLLDGESVKRLVERNQMIL